MTLSKVFEATTLGDLSLSNRIVLASLTRGRSGPSRVPGDHNVEYYRQRATNFGLILTEAASISPMGEGWRDSASLITEEQMAGWKKVVDACHKEGAQIVAQMWHTGRAGHSSYLPEDKCVSASNIPIPGDGVYTADGTKQPHEVPRPLTVDEVKSTIEDYKAAAQRCKDAGFDGVEVHAANGYLLDQFLQTCSNDRTDEYGGSVENRFRFLKEVFEAVFTVYPPSRVGVKISPNGVFNGMGAADNFDSFSYFFDEIDKLGLAYVQTMDGLAFGFHEKCAPMELADIKKHLPNTAIMANCGYTPESAETAVQSGNAEAVAFGRPTLANPDYVDRLKNGYPIADTLSNDMWFTVTEEIRANPSKGYIDMPAKYVKPE